MPLSFVDELEEHVVDRASDERTKTKELAIYPVQRCLEEVALARILGVEELKQVEHEGLLYVAFRRVGVEVWRLYEAEEKFINDLKMRPGELEYGLVFFWVKCVACWIDRRGYRAEEVCRKLHQM